MKIMGTSPSAMEAVTWLSVMLLKCEKFPNGERKNQMLRILNIILRLNGKLVKRRLQHISKIMCNLWQQTEQVVTDKRLP